jgi:hypothetical protein
MEKRTRQDKGRNTDKYTVVTGSGGGKYVGNGQDRIMTEKQTVIQK